MTKAIVKARSPFNTRIFVVPKTGSGLRLVKDLRKIDTASYEDRDADRDARSSITHVGVHQPAIFLALNLMSAYWKMVLEASAQPITAFTVPHLNKQFQWVVTLIGAKGAAPSFSRLMGHVVQGLTDSYISYIDDLLFFDQSHCK